MTGKFIAVFVIGILLSGTLSAQTTRKKRTPKRVSTTTTKKTTVVSNPAPLAPPKVIAPAPTPVPTPPPPPSLDTILGEADKQASNYEQTFKDLLATETKTFQRYDKNGEAKKPTIIESDFLVYQSPRDVKMILELRNVVKVDGKLIPDGQSRSQKFLADLQKAGTAQTELEKIIKEGTRYDKTIEVYGYTLFEGRILEAQFRPYFDYQLLDTENYDGREVYVIGYRQNKNSPFITLNNSGNQNDNLGHDYSLEVPNELKNSEARVNGKLWIDKQTYQIWRQEEELTVQDAGDPLVLLKTRNIYQPSDYGILVPKQIILQTNDLKKDKDSGRFQSVADTSVTFDYTKFKQVNTDVKVIDDTN